MWKKSNLLQSDGNHAAHLTLLQSDGSTSREGRSRVCAGEWLNWSLRAFCLSTVDWMYALQSPLVDDSELPCEPESLGDHDNCSALIVARAGAIFHSALPSLTPYLSSIDLVILPPACWNSRGDEGFLLRESFEYSVQKNYLAEAKPTQKHLLYTSIYGTRMSKLVLDMIAAGQQSTLLQPKHFQKH